MYELPVSLQVVCYTTQGSNAVESPLPPLVSSLPHDSLFVPAALGAIPLALGLVGQVDTVKVKPLDGTGVVVAANHLSIGYLKTQHRIDVSLMIQVPK